MESCQPTRDAILAALPHLRAYAVILVGSKDRADDLIQQTLVRALAQVDTSKFRTSTLAWLIAVLRSHVVPENHKRCHDIDGASGLHRNRLLCQPDQNTWTELDDFGRAVATLPLDQREAIVLVEGSRFSYEQAARICGCSSQTIRSRVNRALTALARALPNQSAAKLASARKLQPNRPGLSVPKPLWFSFDAVTCTRRIST